MFLLGRFGHAFSQRLHGDQLARFDRRPRRRRRLYQLVGHSFHFAQMHLDDIKIQIQYIRNWHPIRRPPSPSPAAGFTAVKQTNRSFWKGVNSRYSCNWLFARFTFRIGVFLFHNGSRSFHIKNVPLNRCRIRVFVRENSRLRKITRSQSDLFITIKNWIWPIFKMTDSNVYIPELVYSANKKVHAYIFIRKHWT